MPINEWCCKECNSVFEIIVNRSEPEPTICFKCGGSLEKLFPSGTNVKYNCLGFHATDYVVRERQRSGKRFGNYKGVELDRKEKEKEKELNEKGIKTR